MDTGPGWRHLLRARPETQATGCWDWTDAAASGGLFGSLPVAHEEKEEREKQSICAWYSTGTRTVQYGHAGNMVRVGSLPDADAGCITDGVSLSTRYLPWWPGDLAGLCHRASLARAAL